jgi:hypothetical protein
MTTDTNAIPLPEPWLAAEPGGQPLAMHPADVLAYGDAREAAGRAAERAEVERLRAELSERKDHCGEMQALAADQYNELRLLRAELAAAVAQAQPDHFPDTTKMVARPDHPEDSLAMVAQAREVPAGMTVERGFEYVPATMEHVPTLTLRFAPVPYNTPNDELGWRDRDSLADWLTAAPRPSGQAEGAEGEGA